MENLGYQPEKNKSPLPPGAEATQTLVDLKQITWQDLKDFVNSIPEEFLAGKVNILVGDNNEGQKLNEPYFLDEDIFYHKDGFPEDCGRLEDLKAMDDEFDINNYEIITKKGTPFLWVDFLFGSK